MIRKKTMSLKWLRANGACKQVRALFKNVFGSSCPLTRDSLVAFALAAECERDGRGYGYMIWLHTRFTHANGNSQKARRRAYVLRNGSDFCSGYGDARAMAEAVAHCLKLPH